MKKRILLITGTFAVLLLAFLVYSATSHEGLPGVWRFRFGVPPPPGESAEVPPVIAGPTPKPDFRQYDKNHRLEVRYRASLQKKVGDRFYIDEPHLEWFLRSGEVISIRARQGVVRASEAAGAWKLIDGDLIGDVWVELDRSTDPDPDRPPLDQRPDQAVRIHLDEAHFDNELLAIQSGSRLSLFSREADLLGQGLRLEWSERPRELRQLRIERGEYLCIREGQEQFLLDMSLPGGAGRATTAPADRAGTGPPGPAGAAPRLVAAGLGPLGVPSGLACVLPAWSNRDVPAQVYDIGILAPQASPGSAPAPAPPEREPAVQDTYVALFTGNVKVASGKRHLHGADELRLVFHYRAPRDVESRVRATTTAPADAPPPEPPRPAGDQTTTRPLPAPRSLPARPPTGAPAGDGTEPVYVTWTGPLVVTALRGTEPPVPKRFDVYASGKKLELADLEGQAECQRFEFRSPAQQGRLIGSPAEPVRLTMSGGDRVTVEQVRFDRLSGQVHLDGPGEMLLTQQASLAGLSPGARGASTRPLAGGQRQDATIRWTRDVEALVGQQAIRTDQAEKRRDFLRQATFNGGVTVRQGDTQSMTGEQLTAFFAEPQRADDPANRLTRLHAAGNVHLADSQTGDFIKSPELDVEMAQDPDTARLYPRLVTATGGVQARQQTTDISGDTLTLHIAPRRNEQTGQSRPEPHRLVAAGNVRITDRGDKQPMVVEADSVDSDLLAETATLKGAPATVTHTEGVIRGRQIFMDNQNVHAAVTGAGSLRFRSDTDLSGNRTDQPRPVDITWTKAMEYYGRKGVATAAGDVKLDTAEDHLQGQTMQVMFEPPPQTATRPAGRLSGTQAFRPGRINLVIVNKEVELVSQRKDAEGYLLRRVWLATEQLVYAFNDAQRPGQPGRKLDCYGPGMASVEDYRAPGTVRAGSGRDAIPGGNLATPSQFAFEWKTSMTMDQQDLTMRAVGEVHVHLRESDQIVMKEQLKVRPWGKLPAGRVADLTCQRMLAQFDSPDQQPGAASAKDADLLSGPRVGPLKFFDAFGDDRKSDDLVGLLDGPWEVHCRRLQYSLHDEIAKIWGAMPGEPARDAVIYYQDPVKQRLQNWQSPELTWWRRTNRVETRHVTGRGGN